MKRVTYRATTIVRVGRAGLDYVDDEGRECFVDFVWCRTEFDHQWGPGPPESPTYVGFRDSAANPPYVDFLAEPLVRFEFSKPAQVGAAPGSRFVARVVPEGYREFCALLATYGVAVCDHG